MVHPDATDREGARAPAARAARQDGRAKREHVDAVNVRCGTRFPIVTLEGGFRPERVRLVCRRKIHESCQRIAGRMRVRE